MRGRSVRRRCFVTDGTRCLLPAFGAYAGGLNVLDEAMRPLFAGKLSVYALSRGRVHAIDPSRCLESREVDEAQVCSTGLKLYFRDELRRADNCPGTRWTAAFVLAREDLRVRDNIAFGADAVAFRPGVVDRVGVGDSHVVDPTGRILRGGADREVARAALGARVDVEVGARQQGARDRRRRAWLRDERGWTIRVFTREDLFGRHPTVARVMWSASTAL